MNFEQEITFEELNKENIKEVYDFCEKNVDHWSQPIHYFELASLNDTQFNPKLTIVARDSSKNVVAFFMGTRRKGMILKRDINVLKFFVVERKYREMNFATWLLHKLYKQFKSLGYKGRIKALTSPPDYWFPGVNVKHTAAIFWLKKNGFKHRMLPFLMYRQNIFVELNNPESTKIDLNKEPINEDELYKYIRITPDYFDKTYNFARKFHDWSEEVKLSYRNDPPTTYIAVKKKTDSIVGFATFNAHFDGSFGPTAVLKSLRGQGIGGTLFKWTLYDLKQTGHERCQILWVVGNTVKFYSKVAGAYIGEILFPMDGKIR